MARGITPSVGKKIRYRRPALAPAPNVTTGRVTEIRDGETDRWIYVRNNFTEEIEIVLPRNVIEVLK